MCVKKKETACSVCYLLHQAYKLEVMKLLPYWH